MIRPTRSAGRNSRRVAAGARRRPTVRRSAGLLAVVAATGLAASGITADASSAVGPGPVGNPTTLSVGSTVSSFDVATGNSGTAYAGWISATEKPDNGRAVHLCTVKPGTSTCAGGVQSVDSLGDSSAYDLRVLVQKSGIVDLLWFYNGTKGSHIGLASTNQSGTLQPAVVEGSAPANGGLLDAEIGPDDAIWTVAGPSSGDGMQVRDGEGGALQQVHTPYNVGFAELAFAGSTPVIATQQGGAITKPAGYAYESKGAWSGVHNVADTWTGARVGLAETSSGLRMIATEATADYLPVVAKWTGTGFSKPTLIGGYDGCAPSSHDAVADASGRLVDIAYNCETLTVSNLAQTTRAAVVAIPSGGTITASPRVATTPRGRAFVVWSIQDGDFEKLQLVTVLLADLKAAAVDKVGGGTVKVTGPASCLPPDSIGVALGATAKSGWKAVARVFQLNGKAVGTTVNGADLVAGSTNHLVGRVKFTKGKLSSVGTATVTFKACPKP